MLLRRRAASSVGDDAGDKGDPSSPSFSYVEEEKMVDEIEGLLMVFSDEYCNKHLLYGVLELILVRLMPELSKMGVQELWDERLG